MRTVRCYIELNLVEGQHFNKQKVNITDDQAVEQATDSFLDLLNTALDLEDYVQARIISEEDSS